MKIKHLSVPLNEISWSIKKPYIQDSFYDHLRTKLCVIWCAQLRAFTKYKAGEDYATSGAILLISSNNPGIIEAHVSGTQENPYRVTIGFSKINIYVFNQFMQDVVTTLDDLERIKRGDFMFFETKVSRTYNFSFIPFYYKKISADCSCPYEYEYCKHSVAVLCALTQAIDDDPLFYFSLCGIPASHVEKCIQKKEDALQADINQANKVSPEFCATFWGTDNTAIKNMERKVIPPQTDAATILKLGKIPVQLNKKYADSFFQEIYHKASTAALKILEEEQDLNSMLT